MTSAATPIHPPSNHFDGQRFFNPGIDTDRSLADLLRWRQTQARVAWPKRIVDPPSAPPPSRVEPGAMALTFIGQSTYLIRTEAGTILTDPIFSERASPFSFVGPRRVRAPGLALDALPKIDLVLLSHNHYDHLDLPSLRALHSAWKPTIVTGLGNGAFLASKGIPGAIELDWWGTCTLTQGWRVTYVPAQHWSSRTMWDRRRMLWGGHVVDTPGSRLYFAGDSGFFDGFTSIRERCGTPDVALLPIGAYEPRWFMKAQHMNPDEAVTAHRTLGASLSLAMHWGTFQLTDEGIKAPLDALAVAMQTHQVAPDTFRTPLPGQTVLHRKSYATG